MNQLLIDIQAELLDLVKTFNLPSFWELKGFDFAGVLKKNALYSLRYYDEAENDEVFVLVWQVDGKYTQYDIAEGPEVRDLMSKYRRNYRKWRDSFSNSSRSGGFDD